MNVDQISKDLKGVKPSKNFSVFLVCLLIAFLFWMLNAFTKNYSTVIEVPIEYTNIPNDKILSKVLPLNASAEVSGSGFRLLSVSYFNSPDPIIIDFNLGNKQVGFKRLVSSFGPDFLRSQIIDGIPSELSLGTLSIDSLKVVVEDKGKNTVRVGASLQMNIEYPFFLDGDIQVSPSEIIVLGANSTVQKLDSIATEVLELGDIQKEVNAKIALTLPLGVESEVTEVEVFIPIDEYTEGKIEVPIQVINKNKSQEVILLPSTVSITYLVGLKKYNEVKVEDFVFTVDAALIEKGKATLIVSKKSSPNFIQIQEYSPHKVEFIQKK